MIISDFYIIVYINISLSIGFVAIIDYFLIGIAISYWLYLFNTVFVNLDWGLDAFFFVPWNIIMIVENSMSVTNVGVILFRANLIDIRKAKFFLIAGSFIFFGLVFGSTICKLIGETIAYLIDSFWLCILLFRKLRMNFREIFVIIMFFFYF